MSYINISKDVYVDIDIDIEDYIEDILDAVSSSDSLKERFLEELSDEVYSKKAEELENKVFWDIHNFKAKKINPTVQYLEDLYENYLKGLGDVHGN